MSEAQEDGRPSAPVDTPDPVPAPAEPRYTKNGVLIPAGAIPGKDGGFLMPGRGSYAFRDDQRRVKLADAYWRVADCNIEQLECLAEGIRPAGWHEKFVRAIYIRMAKEFLYAGNRGTPTEMNDRMEGPVINKTEISGQGGAPIVLTTYLPPPAAAQPRKLPSGDAS